MNDFRIENGILVRYIGHDADIAVPNGVKRIEDGAIDLTAIDTLRIPKSVRRIGVLAPIMEKAGCRIRYTNELPNKPTIFFDCNLSEYLRIHNESAWVFNYGCKVMVRQRGKYVCLQELKEITIPNDIVFLEDQLSYCKMKKVILGKKIKSLDGTFFMCADLEEVVFNDCLGSIGEDAFSDCASLGPIVRLPLSVEYLGLDCFRNCQKLKAIYSGPDLDIEFRGGYPFGEIDHEVRILDSATNEEIFVHRP